GYEPTTLVWMRGCVAIRRSLPNPCGDCHFVFLIEAANAPCQIPGIRMSLPEQFRDAEHLEDVMATPTPELVADLARVDGDIIILGVGGKIGPTLAQMAKRAAPGKRVVGVARF